MVPYAVGPDQRRAWSLSEIAAAQYRIASCPVPPELQSAADSAPSEWGRYERKSPFILLGLLIPDDDGYILNAHAESGAAVVA